MATRPGDVRITVDLDAATHKRLRLLAVEEGRHVSDIVRELVAARLAQHDQKKGEGKEVVKN